MAKKTKGVAAKAGRETEHIDDPRFHPTANIFPLMSDEQLKTLATDIKKRGQQLSITRFMGPGTEHRGKIIDGRNRFRACEIAGVAPDIIERDDIDDPIAFVISANEHRRHLTRTQQRERIVAALKNDPTKSNNRIANELHLSDMTVAAVRRHLEAAFVIPKVERRVGRDKKARGKRKTSNSPQVQALPDTSTNFLNQEVDPSPPVQAPEGSPVPSPTNGADPDDIPPGTPPAQSISKGKSSDKKSSGGKGQPPSQPARNDIGANSGGEAQRFRADNADLHNKKRLLEMKIEGLKGEIADARAGAAPLPADVRRFLVKLLESVADIDGEPRADVFRRLDQVLDDLPMSKPDDPESLQREA
jgi:hypothetical protein